MNPTPAQITQALAAVVAANPAAPPLVWGLYPHEQRVGDFHLHASTCVEYTAPDDEVTERVEALRTWARALGVPLEVRGEYIADVTVTATLPHGVRLRITEIVHVDHLPADLTPAPADAEPLPF